MGRSFITALSLTLGTSTMSIVQSGSPGRYAWNWLESWRPRMDCRGAGGADSSVGVGGIEAEGPGALTTRTIQTFQPACASSKISASYIIPVPATCSLVRRSSWNVEEGRGGW
ncbi:hypothetical protein B0H16DRAFT_1594802 [Mycena metata]|uniref:Secreted protein n=1 Tax=Mycena metata TaxID=1033252 RepID=A0AAD7HPJ8_9AGAR|nr:hypothetical protein B0H16DRAFT_1594802 [Mycena metata]